VSQPELADDFSDDADRPGDHESTPEIALDPPVTGDAAVDESTTAVARAVTEPLEDQVRVIEAAHRVLQDRLADVEG
jgi:hypothetical protein